jgi:hypothetical protein
MSDENRPESIQNYFQPGVAELHYEKLASFLIDHFKNINLKRPGIEGNEAPDLEFWSSEEFWNDILFKDQRALRWVRLVKFQIVDWFPRTPGLFHTRDAVRARHEAQQYLREENGVKFYEPRGKTHMIDGGLGAVRFKTVNIENSDCWLCTATSDKQCHSGVPLAVPNYFMNKIDSYSNYRITGQTRFLPKFLERHFNHMSRVPQIYLLVDNVERFGQNQNPPTISPMVFFTSERQRRHSQEGNVTFVHCRSDSSQELDLAGEWLSEYVHRYGNKIITNFDEQRPIFKDAPFSLQKILNGEFDKNELHKFDIHNANIICDSIDEIYAEVIRMSKNEINIGEGSTVIGDVVAANSIRSSFNKVANSKAPEHLRSMLNELNKAVVKMAETLPQEKAQEVSRDLETFVSEATSESPRKNWCKTTLESIKEVAKTAGEIGKPILEIAKGVMALIS